MDKGGCEPDRAVVLVDGGGLNSRDLVLAQAFAHKVEPSR